MGASVSGVPGLILSRQDAEGFGGRDGFVDFPLFMQGFSPDLRDAKREFTECAALAFEQAEPIPFTPQVFMPKAA